MDENAWNQVLKLIVTAWIHIRLSTSRTIDTIIFVVMHDAGSGFKRFKIHRPPKIHWKFASNHRTVCETWIFKMIRWTHRYNEITLNQSKSLITNSLTGMKMTTIPPLFEICTSNTKPVFFPQQHDLPLFGSRLLLRWMQIEFNLTCLTLTHTRTYTHLRGKC